MSLFFRGELTQTDVALLQLKTLTPTVQDYIVNNLESLVQKYVIPECRLVAQAINVPQGFIEGINYKMLSKDTFQIYNDWGNSKKPLAIWFNYGTKDHGPVVADRLHWIDKTTGEPIYARWVRGVPRTMAMETGIEAGMKRLISVVLLECKDEVRRKLGIDE